MNPIHGNIQPHSFAHQEEGPGSLKDLLALPSTFHMQHGVKNTYAISWLAHVVELEVPFLSKETEQALSEVYFFLVAKAIGNRLP